MVESSLSNAAFSPEYVDVNVNLRGRLEALDHGLEADHVRSQWEGKD